MARKSGEEAKTETRIDALNSLIKDINTDRKSPRKRKGNAVLTNGSKGRQNIQKKEIEGIGYGSVGHGYVFSEYARERSAERRGR
jgi:hypothetical protein